MYFARTLHLQVRETQLVPTEDKIEIHGSCN
jgi:hypothetical protein